MLILASASPRRKQILQSAGFRFAVFPAETEKHPENAATPEDYVAQSALFKAAEVAEKVGGESLVLGADTVVVSRGVMIGKPQDETDAFSILKGLSGRTHEVYTGFALVKGKKTFVGAEKTKVTLRVLKDEEIHAYIRTGEPMDKAGAYGIQGRGSLLITGIEGDYYNVMGLPVCRVYGALSFFADFSLLDRNI